jgi:hypothetical protein
MEDSSKYSKRSEIKGMTEVFRVYYDKHRMDFYSFLLIETLLMDHATKMEWKLFKAFPSKYLNPYMVGLN